MSVVDPAVRETIPPAVQRELDRLRARVDFPLADADVLNLLDGTPEQMRSSAQKLHEMAVKANSSVLAPDPAPPAPPAPAPPTAVAPVAPPAGGGPVPVPGSGEVVVPEHVVDARYDELRNKVEMRVADEFERQEFFMSALRNGWNAQIERMNERPGRH